jgi:hypothetical protein
MSVQRFNVDDMAVRTSLLKGMPPSIDRGALPRQTTYGAAPGLVPFGEAYPDKLIQPGDYKAAIEHCEIEQIFPIYHEHATWAPPGFRWNQNGLNYCWSWGGTAALMDLRAREGKPTVQLSPVSMGYLVNWRNAGNYLESMIGGLKEHGVCEASFTPDLHSIRPKSFKDGWEANALKYRLGEVWDCDPRNMLQHALSVLATGTPLYIAYNWWGHALECVGIRWDTREKDNVVWIIRNSHDEDDVIELTGNKGVPDEAYGFRASVTEVG